MTRKTLLGIATLAAVLPALVPGLASGMVPRVVLVEEFGYLS